MDSARKPSRNLAFLVLLLMQACAHTPSVPQTADAPSAQAATPPTETELARQQITKLQDRVQDLEVRLSALNDKINLENGGPSSAASNALPTAVVEAPAAHGKVVPKKSVSKGKPAMVAGGESSGSASSSEAVDRFREAKILYDTKRYSDSVLEFSEFVKNESDHPLAAAAQYYVGMSYFKQNEYKLAEEELSRGLLSYGHSSYVPDTLLALSQVSASLKKTAKVNYYREKLMANFPNSPQAKSISNSGAESKTESKSEPKAEAKAEVEMAAPGGSTNPVRTMETADEPTVVTKPERPSVAAPLLEESQ